MIRVKICGIMDTKDALKAASLGACAVGFIFYKKSPRHVGAYKAKKIIEALPPFVTPVGVFVGQKEGAVKDIARFCGLTTLQFHGDEDPAYCKRFAGYKIIKAFRVDKQIDVEALKKFKVDAFLFDAYQEDVPGGTGKTFDWSYARAVKSLNVPVILSGGLHHNNVQEAVEEVRPYAVDVSSGVEDAPGKKNARLMQQFIEKAGMWTPTS